MNLRLGGWARGVVAALPVVAMIVTAWAVPVDAQTGMPARIYLTLNKSQVLDLKGQPLTKVLVANPNVADIQVVTPTQLMLVGKTNGMTSLVLLGAQGVVTVDLIVQPGPVMPTRVPDAKSEPHSVLVQRADKMTESVFVRDQDGNWVELGSARIEGEAAKK